FWWDGGVGGKKGSGLNFDGLTRNLNASVTKSGGLKKNEWRKQEVVSEPADLLSGFGVKSSLLASQVAQRELTTKYCLRMGVVWSSTTSTELYLFFADHMMVAVEMVVSQNNGYCIQVCCKARCYVAERLMNLDQVLTVQAEWVQRIRDTDVWGDLQQLNTQVWTDTTENTVAADFSIKVVKSVLRNITIACHHILMCSTRAICMLPNILTTVFGQRWMVATSVKSPKGGVVATIGQGWCVSVPGYGLGVGIEATSDVNATNAFDMSLSPSSGDAGTSTIGSGFGGTSTIGPGVAASSTIGPGVSGTSTLGPGVASSSITGLQFWTSGSGLGCSLAEDTFHVVKKKHDRRKTISYAA
ncbi:hypothetical protein M8C21_012391, partial [Ambrosia artemisiifolia]